MSGLGNGWFSADNYCRLGGRTGKRGRRGISLGVHAALNGSLSSNNPTLISCFNWFSELLEWADTTRALSFSLIFLSCSQTTQSIIECKAAPDMIPCSENIWRTNLPHLRHSFLHKGRDGRLVQLGGLHSPPSSFYWQLSWITRSPPLTSGLLGQFGKGAFSANMGWFAGWILKIQDGEVLWSWMALSNIPLHDSIIDRLTA